MKYLLIVLCTIIPFLAFAVESGLENNEFALDCEKLEKVETVNFNKLSDKAQEVNKFLCESLLNVNLGISNRELIVEREQRKLLSSFAKLAEQEAMKIAKDVKIDNIEIPFIEFSKIIAEGDINSKHLPLFSLELVPINGEELYKLHFSNITKYATFRPADNMKCKKNYFNKNCDQLFDEYGSVVGQYQESYRKLTANETIKQLDALLSQWDRYLGEARSQTTLELLVTTWIESDHFKQGRYE